MSTKLAARWEQSDLIRRVIVALDFAKKKLISLTEGGSDNDKSTVPIIGGDRALLPKIVAETAMLLVCAAPIRCLDQRIGEYIEEVAALLIHPARNDDVRSAICLDPGLARDYAVAHILLSRLGYSDKGIDKLLEQSLKLGSDFGPERLPHRLMEQRWLDRVAGNNGWRQRRESQLLADSMLGRTIDALGSSRLDIYAFTHSVMYATDLGERTIKLSRPRTAVAMDADVSLAYSLDSNDFDLTAEVLLTWPMLRLAWSPSAIFAFRLLASIEDRLGFLPGSAFDLHRYESLSGDERWRFALATSYHTMYVMGFVCATALRSGCTPLADVPSAWRSKGAAKAILDFFDYAGTAPSWLEAIDTFTPAQQDAVAPLILNVLLRRARSNGDLKQLRAALEVALAFDLIRGPAISQAAALLIRSQAIIT